MNLKSELYKESRRSLRTGRQERRMNHMVKINVISGFLGAGKTTLIRKLLTIHYGV